MDNTTHHPLLLQDSSKHYATKGQNNICEFEQDSTIGEAFGAIRYNLIKYKNREKGQNELDDKKIKTFEAWRELLKDLLEMGYQRDRNLRNVMEIEFPDMKYSLGG